MPAIPLRTPSPSRTLSTSSPNPLPEILHTPSGLAIIEIQGTLHLPSSSSTDTHPVATARIGRLDFPLLEKQHPPEKGVSDAWMKSVHLYIGQHQRMTGEVKKLAKPLAIIRKSNSNVTPQDSSVASANVEELEMVDIIRYKLVFSHRPEPVGVEQ